MDPKYLKEYSSEKHFVLYEAGAYTGLCGDMVVFRARGGMFAGPQKGRKKLKWVLLIFEPFVPFCG